MNNLTAEQAIRKVANSLINTHRPQLGACHSTAVEASLEALAELADELSLLDIYAELTKRLDILRGGCRPHIIGVDMAAPDHDVTVECLFHPPFANELKGTIRSQKEAEAMLDVMCILSGYEEEKGGAQ